MNDHNASKEEILELSIKQEYLYKKAFENVLHHKKIFLKSIKPYEKELLVLRKLINKNKAREDSYAVLRDEVKMKSYQILQIQNKMSKHILRALDLYSLQDFTSSMNKAFIKNQLGIEEFNTVDYKVFLNAK